MAFAAWCVQSCRPSSAASASSLSSIVVTKTRPSTTVGADRVGAPMPARQRTEPFAASSATISASPFTAYRVPWSSARPPPTLVLSSSSCRVSNRHRRLPAAVSKADTTASESIT